MPALRTAVEMALTAVQSELSSWVISPVPRAFLPSSMTKRVRVTIFVSKAAWSVMLRPGCGALGGRCGIQMRDTGGSA